MEDRGVSFEPTDRVVVRRLGGSFARYAVVIRVQNFGAGPMVLVGFEHKDREKWFWPNELRKAS